MSLAPSQHKEIAETLERAGLSAPEQKAYLDLLANGASSATPVARRIGLPATTVQAILNRLGAKGVVHTSKHKSRSVYEAKDPVVFKNLLEQSLREITQAIPLLKELKADAAAPAKIRIYARERATDVFRQALSCKEKTIYEIVSAKDLQETLGERFHFTRRRVASGIALKSLRVEAAEIKKYSKDTHAQELREAKFLPREFTFPCSVMFWDDTVAFFAAAPEDLAWTVRSPSFRAMQQQLFDLLWSLGRKMETA